MKKVVLPLFMLLGSLSLEAQSPTKETTIEYIRKRIAESVGHQVVWKQGNSNYIMSTSFDLSTPSFLRTFYQSGNNPTANYTLGNWYQTNTWDFNPEYILSVSEGSGNNSANSAVGFISISFSNNLVKKVVHYTSFIREGIYNKYVTNITEQGNVSVLFLPYLKQDPNTFERIKKALLHLKALSIKADPFAN